MVTVPIYLWRRDLSFGEEALDPVAEGLAAGRAADDIGNRFLGKMRGGEKRYRAVAQGIAIVCGGGGKDFLAKTGNNSALYGQPIPDSRFRIRDCGRTFLDAGLGSQKDGCRLSVAG
jgi:hypothetical protein